MSEKTSRALRMLSFLALCLALALTLSWQERAYAAETSGDELPDVMLAVVTNSENDGTDTFYMSADGVHFEWISEAFVNLNPNDPNDLRAVGSGTPSSPVMTPNGWERTWPLYSFKCPSLIYHNGYFWMLSNEAQSVNGQLALVISNSKDLVHWCDQRRVTVDVAPGWTGNGNPGQFDAAAADWTVGADGNVYAVVSIGRYGGYHGDPQNDSMFPYLVKITELSGRNDPAYNPIGNDSSYITVRTETAVPIVLPQDSHDRIDGSLYVEGGTTYLSIKENGVTNEIWSINDLSRVSDRSAWTLVNGNVLTGFEAPSLTKLNGTYYMFTDELADWTPNDYERPPYYSTGTHVQTSLSLSSGWTNPQRVDAYKSDGTRMSLGLANNPNGDGPRHGTVITVTDPAAKKVIWEAREAAGWTSELPGLPNSSGYTDVPDDAWFYDAVMFAKENGIMRGIGETVFGAGTNLDRSALATMLWRYAEPGEAGVYNDRAENETGMPDVAANSWYTGAANWAVGNGVINGVALPDGSRVFDPQGVVSREMMVVMIVNYINPDLSKVDYAPFDALSDSGLTSSWAREQVAWAVEHGIINGTPDGRLEPGRNVLREEAATIMMNAIQAGIL